MLQRWLSPRAVLFHVMLAAIVPGCIIAGWWQMHRALDGNTLSWAYTFEWPIFAVIAAVGWWQLVHEDPADLEARRAERRRRAREVGPPTPDPIPASWAAATATATGESQHAADEQPADSLDDYNAYLASLASSGKAKTWRNPRGLP